MKQATYLLLLTALLLLTGCAAGDNDTATAVDFLTALDQGNVEAAANYVCTDRQHEIASALVTTEEAVETRFRNVSCAQRGGEVACRFTVVQETTAADDTTRQFDRQVVFEIEDERICGFEEEVAN